MAQEIEQYGIQYKLEDAAAAVEPIDTPYFKQHARIDFNVDDSLIDSYIKAARQELEYFTQKSFVPKAITLTALKLPVNYKLMYGPVDTINTPDFTVKGDILVEGGEDVEIEYTTTANTTDLVKVAIARYAAGIYAIREHIITNEKGDPVNGGSIVDEAKKSLGLIKEVILF